MVIYRQMNGGADRQKMCSLNVGLFCKPKTPLNKKIPLEEKQEQQIHIKDWQNFFPLFFSSSIKP